jgi:hypothetical protein
VGLFFTLYLLFVRLAPVVSMFELRKLAHQRDAASREAPT